MKVTATLSQPDDDPAAVFAMMIDRTFQEQKCAASGALSYSVDIGGTADQPIVRTVRKLPSDGLPDFVRAMVRDGITVEETYTWAAAEPNDARSADVVVSFVGQPLKMTGTFQLRPDGSGTGGELRGDLRAGIPLFGGRIESATEPVIVKAVELEQDLGRTWLAEHRA